MALEVFHAGASQLVAVYMGNSGNRPRNWMAKDLLCTLCVGDFCSPACCQGVALPEGTLAVSPSQLLQTQKSNSLEKLEPGSHLPHT